VSVSRGCAGGPRLDGAEYVCADVRNLGRLTAVFGDIRPDVVFHVAAQRDPGLAEHEVHRTVTTNVLGTRNVIAAAARSGVSQVVCASTGKALRPYSPDVYTASKRVTEWLLSRAAARGGASYSAVRFTHVVDNSIIHARLLEWCKGGVIRLHSPDAVFYAQSALESAQLLLGASVGAGVGALRLHAITDLGWPVSLLDMALGVLARTGSNAPIYLSGYDHGYEAVPFPGLYDPETAGAVSPLLNTFEAAQAGCSPCPGADAFPLEVAPVPEVAERMQALDEVCARTHLPGPVRAALDELSWSLLDATLKAVPCQALVRAAALIAPHRDSLNAEHRRLLAVIEHHMAVAESSLV
jgi:nucleoside-diphosphate-sugar epimerase